ncbi:hypothetical protein Efla_006012 [Eimeria flavescens]
MVDMLLGGMKWVSATVYVDDIIVYRDAWADHHDDLRQIFTALRAASLTSAPREVLFCSEPFLAHPDGPRPLSVDFDGLGGGLGAVRLQQHDEDAERAVAYAFRSLLDHENKWTARGPEAAALIWALETFCPYIDGIKVFVRSDHAPLEYICKSPDQRPIAFNEFRDRTMLHPRALPSQPAPSLHLCCQHLCLAVQRQAQRSHGEAPPVRHHQRQAPPSPPPAGASSTPVPPLAAPSSDPADPPDSEEELVIYLPDDEGDPTPTHSQPSWSLPPRRLHRLKAAAVSPFLRLSTSVISSRRNSKTPSVSSFYSSLKINGRGP